MPTKSSLDAIDWFENTAKGRKYDPAIIQLIMALVAMHTTTDMTLQTLLDLCLHPELIEPMRTEIVTVLGTEGWKKTALSNLKLMDSVIKESQRMKPVSSGM